MTDNRLILSNFLPYVLSVVSNEISQKIAYQYQEKFGIDMPQWRVMAILGEESGLSAREVANRTAMDKVAVSRAVKKLMENNLLTREVAADDKRRSILDLTIKGKETYQQIVPIAQLYEQCLIEQLSNDELSQIHQLLSKLRKANQDISNCSILET